MKLLRLFIAALFLSQSCFASSWDQYTRGQSDQGNRGTDLNRVTASASVGTPVLPSGRYQNNAPQLDLSTKQNNKDRISESKFNGAVDSVTRSTGLTGRDTVKKVEGGVTSYFDKKTGEKLVSIERSGVSGSREAKITMHEQSSQLATVGVRIPSGRTEQTQISMAKGNMVLVVTENSAQFGLAETAEAGKELIMDNATKLQNLSPGGPSTINAVQRSEVGSQHVMSVAVANAAPVVVYNSNGSEPTPASGRGFGNGAEVASAPSQDSKIDYQAADINVTAGDRTAPITAAFTEKKGSDGQVKRTLVSALPSGLAGQGQTATVTLKNGTQMTLPAQIGKTSFTVDLSGTKIKPSDIKSVAFQAATTKQKPQEDRAFSDSRYVQVDVTVKSKTNSMSGYVRSTSKNEKGQINESLHLSGLSILSVPKGTDAVLTLKNGASVTAPVRYDAFNEVAIDLSGTNIQAKDIKAVSFGAAAPAENPTVTPATPVTAPKSDPAPSAAVAPATQNTTPTPAAAPQAESPAVTAATPVAAQKSDPAPSAAVAPATQNTTPTPATAPQAESPAVTQTIPVTPPKSDLASSGAVVPTTQNPAPTPAADTPPIPQGMRTMEQITQVDPELKQIALNFAGSEMNNFAKTAYNRDGNISASGNKLIEASESLRIPQLTADLKVLVQLSANPQANSDQIINLGSHINDSLHRVGLHIDVSVNGSSDGAPQGAVLLLTYQIKSAQTIDVQGQTFQSFTLSKADGLNMDLAVNGHHNEGTNYGFVNEDQVIDTATEIQAFAAGEMNMLTIPTNSGPQPLPGLKAEMHGVARAVDQQVRAEMPVMDHSEILQARVQSTAIHEAFHAYFEKNGGEIKVEAARGSQMKSVVQEQGAYLFQLAGTDARIAKVILMDMFNKATTSGGSTRLGTQSALRSLQNQLPNIQIFNNGTLNMKGIEALFKMDTPTIQSAASRALQDDVLRPYIF